MMSAVTNARPPRLAPFIPASLPIATLFAMTLALAACGKPPADQQDLASLDAELTNGSRNAQDPALSAALAGQIMVDPRLTQSSNADAVRPPTRPDNGAVPRVDVAPRTDPTNPATLKRAPAASGSCPECKAANGALTLGALAERQRAPRMANCADKIQYSAGWANRLPAELPLYPDARLSEAAGADRDGCALRIVSFSTGASVDRVLDYYFTRTSQAGYSAGHRTDGRQHVLGGTRGDAAYVVYASARSGGGSEVDLVTNAGR